MSVSESPEQLANRLLHQAIPDSLAAAGEGRSDRDRRPPVLEMVLISLFIAFHVTTLLVYSTPGEGLGARVRQVFNRYLEMDGYMELTANATRWEMFAPDPPRGNPFVRVMVEDRWGQVRDLGHEIYGRRVYPYLFFDRLAKINGWGLAVKRHRQAYAAWVCREWEREHGGEPAAAVRLVRFMTEIPPPEVAYAAGGYHPLLLEVKTLSRETFQCRTLPHGQLSPALRARHGFPPAPDGTFQDLEVATWRSRAPRRQSGGTAAATGSERAIR